MPFFGGSGAISVSDGVNTLTRAATIVTAGVNGGGPARWPVVSQGGGNSVILTMNVESPDNFVGITSDGADNLSLGAGSATGTVLLGSGNAGVNTPEPLAVGGGFHFGGAGNGTITADRNGGVGREPDPGKRRVKRERRRRVRRRRWSSRRGTATARASTRPTSPRDPTPCCQTYGRA